jgi:sugar O-acyltransferase (sialic acid O-acetyltransferase NeuD family)
MGSKLNKIPKKMILWGGTGQAIVIRPIIEHYGSRIIAIFDDTVGLKSPFSDVPIYNGWSAFQQWLKREKRGQIGFCVAIGNPHGWVRLQFHERLSAEGLKPVAIAHPTAWIAPDAEIGEGSQIMAGVIIQPKAKIGRCCIINTRASIDHEDILEDGVEIAPGATLCGNVHAGINAWICAGATILPRITIGADAVIGAGAVVNRDVPAGQVVVGVPARPLIRSKIGE